MLHRFIAENRSRIIDLCGVKAAEKHAPELPPAELVEGIPLFLDQLTDILRIRASTSSAIRSSAARYGSELLALGCTVGQVVHAYGDVCQSIADLALEQNAPMSIEDFRTLNRCLDDAIAEAVTEYGRVRDEGISRERTERLGIFAHELRNLLNVATLSFDALKGGTLGLGGATGSVLERSLTSLTGFADRALAEARLEAGIEHREKIDLSEFLDEVEVAAGLEGRSRGMGVSFIRGERGAVVDADRQILASVVMNLLQNAFKFTRPDGRVMLKALADAGRVRVEIEDECGGLPPGDPNGLFIPFSQRGVDRTGLGLGLAISKRGVEASGGELQVKNLPGQGCVFAVDLPLAGFLSHRGPTRGSEIVS